MGIYLNDRELSALYGIPELHMRVYVLGIRPYMDYATGIVGIKRGISWQSLREALYVEPARGRVVRQSPGKSQVRRAVEGLVRGHLIAMKSEGQRLVFECLLADRDFSVQKKPDRRPTHPSGIDVDTQSTSEKPLKQAVSNNKNKKADTELDIPYYAKADTPLRSKIKIKKKDITNVISQKGKNAVYFLAFWESYPRKENRKKAFEIWVSQNLDSQSEIILADVLQRKTKHQPWRKGYIPHAARYLNEERWLDELQEGNAHDQTDTHTSHQRRGKEAAMWRVIGSCLPAVDANVEDDT